jgi:hypothetical protein
MPDPTTIMARSGVGTPPQPTSLLAAACATMADMAEAFVDYKIEAAARAARIEDRIARLEARIAELEAAR